MKRILSAGGALLLFAVLGLGTTAASAGGTPCTGPMGPTPTIQGDLIAGAGCVLNGTTVTGNVKVIPGGSLTTSGATIGHNVQSDRATSIVIVGGSVGGDVQLQGTLEDATGRIVVSRVVVNGNVQLSKNTTNGADSGQISVILSTIHGNVQLQDNQLSGRFNSARVQSNTIDGNVEVHGNQLIGNESNVITASHNSIGGNLDMHDNQTINGTDGGAVVEVQATVNAVGGSLEFHKNTAAGSGVTSNDVDGNAITNNLDCKDDSPPASGGANTAKQKNGECAGL